MLTVASLNTRGIPLTGSQSLGYVSDHIGLRTRLYVLPRLSVTSQLWLAGAAPASSIRVTIWVVSSSQPRSSAAVGASSYGW